MRVAKYLDAATILVVDIDRGGAFAHVVGTLELLEPEERALIKGIVINKFRGQKSLLDSGITWLEDYTKIPVLGVLPYSDIFLSAEDSLSLLDRPAQKPKAELNISVIRLPHIANFTDFDPLCGEATVNVRYLELADLIALNQSGMANQLQAYHQRGGIIFGICGGLQMLGRLILDPDHREGHESEAAGLNLLPLKTVITAEKITRQRQVLSNYPQAGLPVMGYEIHQGISEWESESGYQKMFEEDASLGIVNDSLSIWGCYLHGIFDNGSWRRNWLNHLRQRRGLLSLPTGIANYSEQREITLDAMANLVEEHLNLKPIFSHL